MLHLSLLGTIDLTADDGRTIHSVLAQPKRLALLSYLAAAHQGFHRRDVLVSLFWPESDEERARNSLRQSIYSLRRSLGDEAIQSRGEEVGVDPECLSCDAVRFEALLAAGDTDEALALYGGDLLEGFHLPDAPDFERWVDAERARLHRRAAEAAWSLADKAERSGDGVEALRWARRAQAFTPDEEASLRKFLALLDHQGERAEALREYGAFAQRLHAEFDLEPSPETQALLAEIRRREAPVVIGSSAERADALSLTVQMPEPEREKAPVAQVGAPENPGLSAGSRITGGRRGGADSSTKPLWEPVWRRRAWGWAAGVALLVAGAFASSPANIPSAAIPVEGRRSLEEGRVLVAAFANRTGEPQLDALGDMAADWIAQGLQQTGLVEVIDPASSLLIAREVATGFAGSEDPARIAALANASGARTIVSGAVYRHGDSILYRAKITDAETGRILHATESITGSGADPVGDLEALRSSVTGALASMVDKRIASTSVPSSRPPTYEAYREYIRGLEAFQRRRLINSLPHFEAAARLDTMFSLPLVWAIFASGDDLQKRDSVLQILEGRRDRLAPLDLLALNYFRAGDRGDPVTALEYARQAARLSPGSPWSHLAGSLSLAMNRPREALEHLRRVDPERGWAKGWKAYWHEITTAYHLLRQHEEELKAAERGRRLDPDFMPHHFYEIRALIALGRIDEARVRKDRALLLSGPDNSAAGELAFVMARELRAHGFPDEAQDQLRFAVDWFRSPALEEWVQGQRGPEPARRAMRHFLGRALYEAQRYEEARSHFQAMMEEDPSDWVAEVYLGLVAAARGDLAEAQRIIGLLQDRKDGPFYEQARRSFELARLAALLGNRAQTAKHLREWMRRNRSSGPIMHLHLFNDFVALQGDSTIDALLRQAN